jgi:dipeptidyl aminopeptidase/acylaminoacyl peptidase
MRSELITWKTLDGQMDQGILYKPENFDPLKKYPLLVYYYERLSDDLHHFLRPELSTGRLNIPLYVSHGYLIFVPDIHYRIGWTGRSAYDAVVSGVNYLCGRKYVDRTKMGLQGHSFGGFETNYIITHTHLFAAAMSASGLSDFVSGYGNIGGNGNSHQDKYEWGQLRIGATFWEKLGLYLENSPVLRADRVTTPLLMMADKQDEIVPFEQGLVFFTALRRLGKKAWMLQYDGQGHTVFDKASLDLTIRMFQFFNYYLKGEPPPAWMTKGIPARLKGMESGLETDTSGAQP